MPQIITIEDDGPFVFGKITE